MIDLGLFYMPEREEKFIEPWIDESGWNNKDFFNLKTPCYLIDEKKLKKNLIILSKIQKETGCKVLMALKGFSMWSIFPLIRKYLWGVAASSLNEARLGFEEFKKEVHIYSPAYIEKDFNKIIKYCDHIIFNSFEQWEKYKKKILENKRKISCGIRVNPEHSEVKTSLYDPCASYSRLGVTKENFKPESLTGIEGLHFHNLCEASAEAFERTLKVFEEKFGSFLFKMRWVNFGGGHHFTSKDYNISLFYQVMRNFRKRYPHLKIYVEPGEAIALNAGVLVSQVLDIIHNKIDIAIVDVSPTCHMPDVLEQPYQPTILGAGNYNEYPYRYQIAGLSCLAGDIIGNYCFPEPLTIGKKIVFLNMAIYTMVKNNTFNGINLPSIILRDSLGKNHLIKKFSYRDFKNRLS